MTGLRALVEAVREARADQDDNDAPVEMTQHALSTFLIVNPDVLTAFEAVETLGKARARRFRWDSTPYAQWLHEGYAAEQDESNAMLALRKIADRLAARKGE